MLAGLPAPLLDAVTFTASTVTFHASTVPPVAVPVGQFLVTVTTDPAEGMPAELRVASPAGELAYFLDHRSPQGLDMLLRLLGASNESTCDPQPLKSWPSRKASETDTD